MDTNTLSDNEDNESIGSSTSISDIETDNEKEGVDDTDIDVEDSDVENENEDEDEDEDEDDDEDDPESNKKKEEASLLKKKGLNIGSTKSSSIDYYDSDSEDEDDKFYKFSKSNIIENLSEYHTNLNQFNNDEVQLRCQIHREQDKIVDNNHKTLPLLTKYEKTRILGYRAKQINSGNKPFIDIPDGLYDGFQIALLELEQKKIPFIIRRPMPNGSSEFWKVSDLEIL